LFLQWIQNVCTLYHISVGLVTPFNFTLPLCWSYCWQGISCTGGTEIWRQ